MRFTAKRRVRTIVASFRDAAGAGATTTFRSKIDWSDGTLGSGVVLSRGNGIYLVRSAKRYRAPGWFPVTVTLLGNDGRRSVARSTAVVRPR
jgi:hypothetical protein